MGDIHAKRLDWRRIIDDLKERGCTVYQAAKILGRPETTVQSWRQDHEPSYSNGASVLLLHSKLCGEELTKIRCNEEVVYRPTGKRAASIPTTP